MYKVTDQLYGVTWNNSCIIERQAHSKVTNVRMANKLYLTRIKYCYKCQKKSTSKTLFRKAVLIGFSDNHSISSGTTDHSHRAPIGTGINTRFIDFDAYLEWFNPIIACMSHYGVQDPHRYIFPRCTTQTPMCSTCNHLNDIFVIDYEISNAFVKPK